MAGPRRTLNVQLELESDSLTGTISGGGADGERVESWLELMSAVEGRRPVESPAAPSDMSEALEA